MGSGASLASERAVNISLILENPGQFTSDVYAQLALFVDRDVIIPTPFKPFKPIQPSNDFDSSDFSKSEASCSTGKGLFAPSEELCFDIEENHDVEEMRKDNDAESFIVALDGTPSRLEENLEDSDGETSGDHDPTGWNALAR